MAATEARSTSLAVSAVVIFMCTELYSLCESAPCLAALVPHFAPFFAAVDEADLEADLPAAPALPGKKDGSALTTEQQCTTSATLARS